MLEVLFVTGNLSHTKMFLSKNISRFVRINITTSAKTCMGIRRVSTVDTEKFKGNYDVIIAGGGMVGCTLACAMGMCKYLFFHTHLLSRK